MNSPETERFLATLKDFQRDTVDYAFSRMYEQSPASTRFLIADEVGLGKTKVAAGIVARATDYLRTVDPDRRIDVVYICSNSGIARQNIKRLNVTRTPAHKLPDRITLLPRYIKQLRARPDNKVNFIAFSPGTSFNLKSSGGRAEERALLYHLLPEDWRVNKKGAISVLMGDMARDRFLAQVDAVNPYEHVDEGIRDAFRSQLLSVAPLEPEAPPSVRLRFLGLADRLGGRSMVSFSDDERRELWALVGELRGTLAAVCVESLEPDIVILDEFQRFSDVLHGTDEASQLAQKLFQYKDERVRDGAVRVLLLSATPYRMFATQDQGTDGHYRDLVQTVAFLQQDESASKRFEADLDSYGKALLRLPIDGGADLRVARDAVQAALSRVMVRTERLGVTADRSGMLTEVASGADLDDRELGAYLEMQALARALEVSDIVEYWKSAPYLLNFMEDYDLKRKLETRIAATGSGAGALPMPTAESGALLTRVDIEAYRRVDPGNARLRALMRDMVESGAWQLLWVPPSWHYYAAEGPYADPKLQRFTKRLIFSSWQVVPKMIAALLTHETERRMLGIDSDGQPGEQTPEARKGRRGLLRFSVADGRPVGMPTLALLYPSFVLAQQCDPQAWAVAGNGDGLPTLAETLARAERVCEGLLAPFTTGSDQSGAVDERWYWAAPLLLDREADAVAQKAWLGQRNLAGVWRERADAGAEDEDHVREERESDTAWQAHVQAARAIVDKPHDLGRAPDDLASVLASLAMAGPGVTALRALARVSGGLPRCTDKALRNSGGQVAEGFRSLFNQPEVSRMVREGDRAYWRSALAYCARGGVQAVLDEYAHVLVEHVGVAGRQPEEIVQDVSGAMREALTLRTATLAADDVVRREDGSLQLDRNLRFRTSYAVRFGAKTQETDQNIARAGDVQKSFNSPFWPFVLCSTSVGQEGLDFHLYCHAVMHWNLPSNPVDLEQREGRVHRYKGHAVRKNVAREFVPRVLSEAGDQPDRWRTLFDAARATRGDSANDLVPFWVFAPEGGDRIERHVPMIPLSKDVARADSLRRSLALYRMAFGQSRQDDLVAFLKTHLTDVQIATVLGELQIRLGPPLSVNRGLSGKYQEPGELGAAEEETTGGASEIGLPALEELLDAYSELRAGQRTFTAADVARLLNDFAAHKAAHPDWSQTWSDTQTLT